MGLATSLMQLGKDDIAINYFRKLDKDFIESPRVGLNYSLALYKAGKKDKSHDVFDDVDKKKAKGIMRAYYNDVKKVDRGKIMKILIVLLILSNLAFAKSKKKRKVIYKYKKYEKFEMDDINIAGDTSNPGDLSINPRFRKKFKTDYLQSQTLIESLESLSLSLK